MHLYDDYKPFWWVLGRFFDVPLQKHAKYSRHGTYKWQIPLTARPSLLIPHSPFQVLVTSIKWRSNIEWQSKHRDDWRSSDNNINRSSDYLEIEWRSKDRVTIQCPVQMQKWLSWFSHRAWCTWYHARLAIKLNLLFTSKVPQIPGLIPETGIGNWNIRNRFSFSLTDETFPF